jgi:hypothetical protein
MMLDRSSATVAPVTGYRERRSGVEAVAFRLQTQQLADGGRVRGE